jgi:hypothetical protein
MHPCFDCILVTYIICVQHVPGGCSSNSNKATEESACNAQKADTNSLLGSYITKEYELLHLVLSHLPLGDLNAASQVCRYEHHKFN